MSDKSHSLKSATGATAAAVPLVRFAQNYGNDVEEGKTLKLVLTLSEASTAPVSVVVQNAIDLADDMQGGPKTVTFAPGQTTAVVKFKTFEDAEYEANDYFRFEITSAENAQIDQALSAAIASGTILNDDPADLPLVRFAQNYGNDVEEGKTLKLVLTLSEASTAPVSVVVQNAIDLADDMQGGPKTVTFAPGQTTAVVKFKTFEDAEYEANDYFRFEITSAENAQIDQALSAAIASGTILNDDPADLPLVRFAQNYGNDVEEGKTLKLVLTLSEASTAPVSVVVQNAIDLADDMQGGPKTVTFAPGQTTAVVKFKTFEDAEYEANDYFRFEITSAENAQIDQALSAAIASGTILNDDPVISASDPAEFLGLGTASDHLF